MLSCMYIGCELISFGFGLEMQKEQISMGSMFDDAVGGGGPIGGEYPINMELCVDPCSPLS